MKKILILCGLLCLLNGETQIETTAKQNRSIDTDPSLTTVSKTYKEPTNSENSKEWNTKDWDNYMKTKGGVDSSIVGNSQLKIQNFKGSDDALSANPNVLQSQNIKNNTKYKDDKGLTSFSEDLVNNIVSSTVSHNANKKLTDTNIKCYITRDIPLRYKCAFTGLTYGGQMESDGSMAKNQCENECYEQYESAELVKEGSISEISLSSLQLNTPTDSNLSSYETERTTKNSINNENVISAITFDFEVNDGKKATISIKHLDMKNVYTDLIRNLSLQGKGSKSVPVNLLTKELSFTLNSKEKSAELKITNIKLKINGGKYICPLQQDISKKNAGNFAFLCPSGNIKTFSQSYKTYSICADYGIVGDNYDGTYSTKAAADAICKKNYTCTLDITTMNTTLLQTFREGCIQGQANCNEDTCKQLRISNATILNENIFDAGLYPKKSIINQTQVQGVNRPRILLNTDLDFQTRSAEELKDEAYKNMIQNNKYAISKVNIDENTTSNSAYSIGISGTSNVSAESARRGLYWLLKPDAYSVGTTIKMYAIYDVILNKRIINEQGKNETVKDRVFYIQINDNDGLKPFARIDSYSKNVLKTDSTTSSYESGLIQSSQLDFKSFNSSSKSWYSHSPDLTAEYFTNQYLTTDDSPYRRIKLISEMNNLVYLFPGVKRRILSSGPVQTPVYDGDYDGTGETISKITVYTYYTSSSITYRNIIEMIDNNEIKPIYDSLSFDKYPKDIQSDSNNTNTQIYLYGKKESKTGFVRIFPKKEDIGKNGFIFIFAVEE